MQTQITIHPWQRSADCVAGPVVSARRLFGGARSTGRGIVRWASVAALMLLAGPAMAQSFSFSTGDPDGRMATASRPGTSSLQEIESADDFVLTNETFIRQATFTGLVPAGTDLSHV